MKVIIADSVYEMGRKQFRAVMEVASKAVPHGIYAVEKDGMAEMKKEHYDNKSELCKQKSAYEKKGFKVYFNEKPTSL